MSYCCERCMDTRALPSGPCPDCAGPECLRTAKAWAIQVCRLERALEEARRRLLAAEAREASPDAL
jgi:DnaJ-class molecular chaperone